jgi:probable HAF family extracellular repeat protein
MESPRIVQLALLGMVVFGGVETAFADAVYSFTTIDVPGATDTSAWGINDSGQIVGYHIGVDGLDHGFLYSGGAFTTINYPGATDTFANESTTAAR